MKGRVAIGRCRYTSTVSTTWKNAQTVFRTPPPVPASAGPQRQPRQHHRLAGAARDAGLMGASRTRGNHDSDILGALLAHGAADATLEQAALELLPTVAARSA